MAKRPTEALDPNTIKSLIKAKKAGRHCDGKGLYLTIEPSGSARWAFLFRWKKPGRAGPGGVREMGLGSEQTVTLKQARKDATEARDLIAAGIDPIAAKRSKDKLPAFGDVADEFIATKSGEFRGAPSLARIKRALEHYAADLRPLRIDAVDTEAVLGVLKPIWNEKPETAQKTRGYIEAVLNAARAKGLRAGENPAAWRGHLDYLLTRPNNVEREGHASMDYEKVPAFVAELRERDATAALALEFLILTGSRAGMVMKATWDQINLAAKLWTIPNVGMKAGRKHEVPLSARSIEILEEADKRRIGPYVFPGQKSDKPMSVMSFDRLRDRMKVTGITTHGFRSSFRDWTGDTTDFAWEIAENAIAHRVGDAKVLAYRRRTALEKRRKLMDAWADYCCGVSASDMITHLPKADAA